MEPIKHKSLGERLSVVEALLNTIITNDLVHLRNDIKDCRKALDRLFWTILGIGGTVILGLVLHHFLEIGF